MLHRRDVARLVVVGGLCNSLNLNLIRYGTGFALNCRAGLVEVEQRALHFLCRCSLGVGILIDRFTASCCQLGVEVRNDRVRVVQDHA